MSLASPLVAALTERFGARVLSASSGDIVGNAPARDGGVAGGLQATSLKIGGAPGTSVVVPVISASARWGWRPSPVCRTCAQGGRGRGR
ncbi:hypothetical protein [Streptomyces roseochromogenus]|uniref:Uncharacterized protein n=1 Tax=Streptomyces roseochromogenus subsp. oscitans DS 12.976 TaxID=1352936 RepID=V6JIL8_STRRC|nr:hypothetical protein M878_41635 [Streptomyces roseochromogenus subsp. oscitans DS 12.976]